jgi:hypothetical protein
VKVYESEKAPTEDDGWRHTRITLKPDSTEERFGPIVLEDVEDGGLAIAAELVAVLAIDPDGLPDS